MGAVAEEIGSRVLFDADRVAFNKDMTQQNLEGNVVAIGAGTLIAADTLAFDRPNGKIEAKGRVVVMGKNAVFLGDVVRYHLKTGDFKIEGATMVVNDPLESARVVERILGFTKTELGFEQKRKLRLAELEEKKTRLKGEARRQAPNVADELVSSYARVLEQSELIAKQPNPSLARLPKERREAITRRREFYERSKVGVAAATKAELPSTLYFKVQGETLTRTDGNDYEARHALFTPCLCEEGESPAWGFRADEMEAQVGGYADLYHPVLEIKGIPVLYLPYIKVPLKDERQTGLLMPTIGFEPRSGNIVRQPVFFALGDNADATFTTDLFEKRGTRVGVEYRIQQRQFSGWELNVEGIRDRLWLDDRSTRQDLYSLYDEGLGRALAVTRGQAPAPSADDPPAPTARGRLEQRLGDPVYWDGIAKEKETSDPDGRLTEASAGRFHDQIDEHFGAPNNTWRGAYAWRGVSFFAPRLSLASNAEILSDHRYTEDLRVPNDFQEAMFGGRAAKAFSTAKAQLHLDGTDFYAGLGARYGDNYLTDERFEGQQMPGRFKLATRPFSLLPKGAPFPLYGRVEAEQSRITEFKDSSLESTAERTLGDGNWRRVAFSTTAPLVSDQIVQVSHFSVFEGRYVDHAGLAEPRSEARTFRTGIDLSLPIDGKGELPIWLDPGEAVCNPRDLTYSEANCEALLADANRPRRYGHHLMDWRLRFSVRPSVVRRGPYTDPDEEGGELSYFASDRFTRLPADEDVPEEERMKPHRRVELSSTHLWKLYRRAWTETAKPGFAPPEGETIEGRARRELEASLRRPIPPDAGTLEQGDKRWLVDGEQLVDQYYDSPMNLKASVAYDFLDALKREKLRAEKAPADTVPEAWKDLAYEMGIRHYGYALTAAGTYGIYVRTLKKLSLGLALPPVLGTTMSVGYTVSKKLITATETFEYTRERSAGVDSTLIPGIVSYIRLKKREIDGQAADYAKDVYTAVGAEYRSTSNCWGLALARTKNFLYPEAEASYLLQLSVIFMGLQRPLPNMAKKEQG